MFCVYMMNFNLLKILKSAQQQIVRRRIRTLMKMKMHEDINLLFIITQIRSIKLVSRYH